jgi:acyl-CoA thioesterase I
MGKKKFLFLAFIPLIIGVWFFWGGKTNIKNYPLKDGSIVAFGDSLVEGVGASKGHDFSSLLSQKIGEPIINLGISGNTSAQGLARIQDVLDEKPRLVLVLLGGNDFLRKVPRDETIRNLRAIIAKVQESGAAVLLLGVRGGLFTDSASGLYEDLADETQSVYVSNVLDGLFGDTRYMFDAIHPNDAGYVRVADKIYPVLAKILK